VKGLYNVSPYDENNWSAYTQIVDNMVHVEAFTHSVPEFVIPEMDAMGVSLDVHTNCKYTFTKTPALQEHDYARVRDTKDLMCVMGNQQFVADFCTAFGERVVAVCIVG